MCDVKFPCDNNGQYVNLPTLKRLRNGDLVIINKIEGPGLENSNSNTIVIPDHIIQFGDLTNLDDEEKEIIEKKIYFKAQKQVSVTYTGNDGISSTTTLQNLKQRGFSIFSISKIANTLKSLSFGVIIEFVRGTNYYLSKVIGENKSKEYTIEDFQEMQSNVDTLNTFSFTYSNSSKCILEFKSSVSYEPEKKFFLNKILNKSVDLALKKIYVKQIQEKAKISKVCPLSLILRDDVQNGDIAKIDLTTCSETCNFYIPKYSIITYKHCSNKTNLSSILVSNFINRGFPKDNCNVDYNHIRSIERKSKVNISYLSIHDDNGNLKETIFPSSIGKTGNLSIPNKSLCIITYDILGLEGLGKDAKIALSKVLQLQQFPRSKIHNLTLRELENCSGFIDAELISFQSDREAKLFFFDKSNFTEFSYSNKTLSFLNYRCKTSDTIYKVSLQNLFQRQSFPHVFFSGSQLPEILSNAKAQNLINDANAMKKVKAVHDFMYGFQEKVCKTCNNKWFVNYDKPPGGVTLNILDSKSHKNNCMFSHPNQEECDRCFNENPPAGLPKMFSAENNMDFGKRYPEITALTTFEEMLISKVTILVSVFTLTSTGFLAYQGHSCSFYQNNVKWFNTLPKDPSECPVILIVRKGVSKAIKRKAFIVNYERIVTGFKKLMEVHPQYASDRVNVNWESFEQYRGNTVPEGINIIEQEMHDIIKIDEILFQKWLKQGTPIAYKLYKHLLQNDIDDGKEFEYLCDKISVRYHSGATISDAELQTYLENSLLLTTSDPQNRDLMLGELSRVKQELEEIENAVPIEYGNVIHGEEEGQTSAGTRYFNDMARSLNGVPLIGDIVVVKEGPLKMCLGKEEVQDGIFKIHFNVTSTLGKNVEESLSWKALHIQSCFGCKPVVYDLVHAQDDEQCLVVIVSGDEYTIEKPDGNTIVCNVDEITLCNYSGTESTLNQPHSSSQYDKSSKPSKQTKTPKPLFDPPTREEKAIPERESYLLSCAFPTLFQVGAGDIYAPRLRSLDEGGQNPLELFTKHCLFWHDNRFAQHPRFLYVLFNRMQREKMLKTKNFYIKHRNPTRKDFLPENRKRMLKDIRAFSSKNPTTTGWKTDRRTELITMTEQLQNTTSKKDRIEKLTPDMEYVDYFSSDDESQHSDGEDQLMFNQTSVDDQDSIENLTPDMELVDSSSSDDESKHSDGQDQLMFNQTSVDDQNRIENLTRDMELFDSSSSDDESQHSDSQDPMSNQASVNDQEDRQSNNKTPSQRPCYGAIPAYFVTLTTAPFRDSLPAYYIFGHHNTSKDVKIRRQIAIENPNVVAFFSAVRLELILKYLLKGLLELDDWYCVFEWGAGGVLHLHSVLWNFKNPYLDEFDLNEEARKFRLSKRKVNEIARFFNVFISEWHLGKDHDGSWKDVYRNVEEEPHPCSITKHEFDELFVLPREELDTDIDEDAIEESRFKRLRHTISLLEKTQQHNSHKPHPFGPPLEGQKCSKKKQKVSSPEEAPCYCAKGYPKPLRPSHSEDIQRDPYREKLYKLSLERNDQTINNYNAPVLLALGANMDIQAVCTYDGLLRYICKYVTKDNSMDIFRDFRDDSGKPTDPPPQQQASHQVPVNNMVTRLFMNLLKFSFISESELSHHALGLPAHFCSRTFSRISLQSELKRLFRPDEACGEEILVKQDELSTYERRSELMIPSVSRAKGVTEKTLKEMSLFYFHRKFYARLNTLCQKKKASIVIFRPYVSPKRENNPEFEKYMLLTLLAYKAFQFRTEFTSLEQDELLETFNEFIDSDLCPYFVKVAYRKANQTRKRNHAMPVRNNQVNNTQDEINEAMNLNTPSEDSVIGIELDTITVPEDDNQVPSSEDTAESDNDEDVPRRRPLATFTRDFQDLGHMGKGLSLDALNLECYDDDNDVQQEINVLSHENDLVFDRIKHSWASLYPDLSQSVETARRILKEKPHIDHASTKYDPKDLDPTQTFLLDLVLDWAKQCIACKIDKKPFPPFKSKLLGVAGTGKSRTVKTIIQEFNFLMKNSSLPENERGEIKICAPTGVAAFNLGCGAGTIHSTFDIRVKEKINDVTGERQKKLEECFENVWLIIIDEISMVGSDLFAKIDIRLTQAKLDENRNLAKLNADQNILNPDFGGLGIIVSGDMAQLPPIQAKSMMDPSLGNSSKEYERLCNKGRELFDGCNITVVLTKQHRQTGGEYTNLCLKFRDGTFTPKDHLLLQSRNFEELPLEEKIHFETYGTRLVSTNEAAGKYNATRMIHIAKQNKQKIFRIQAQETGCLGQPLESSDKFGGLKSKIHLTIGPRVMLSNNLWIEAGLINGAQGIVVDIVFHEEEKEEDAVPKYVIVNFDEYGGPPFFDNPQYYNWVPIFPISRRHQNNSKMERTGIPLRSSWCMTGFKVQGLNLYNGAVNDYPNLNTCKKRTKDPMGTWGLNYCMLTRVPDISKIAFINLPDYQRHMKLYQNNPKKRGKIFFKMFLDFDKKSFAEFGKLFNFCTGYLLKDLSNATQNFSLNSPIDFQHISKEEWKSNLKIDFQPSFNNYFSTSKRNLKSKANLSKPSSSSADKDLNPANRVLFQPKSRNVSISKTSNLIQCFPRFLNTSGTDCWLNSVLQLLILAMKHKPTSDRQITAYQRQAFITGPENIICDSISNFALNPSTYSVASIIDYVLAPYSCQLSLKKIMLVAMGMPSLQELTKQQDAAECLTRILNMPPFSYLSGFYQIQTKCRNCDDGCIVREKIPIFITDIKIECDINGTNKHSGKDDIECHFNNAAVFQRNCGKCGAVEGTKMIKPESQPDFVMVNFNLFKSDMTKINVESDPFNSVEISTEQGASVYNVIGSIEHIGGNIHHGHYISYIKLGQTWFCCNDSAITQLDDYLTATRKPYIVFLKKD